MTASVVTEEVRTRAVALAFDDAARAAAAGSRTIAASLSSDVPLMRYGEIEVLSHEPDAVDLGRADGGLPLLIGHDDGGIPIGVVEGLRLDGGRLRGVLRFATSARAEEALQAVRDGALRSTSVRYRVRQLEAIFENGQRVGATITKWELLEVSLVAVPFDPSVGIGRSLTREVPMQETSTEQPVDEASTEHAEINELCRRHRVGDAFTRSLLATPAITLASARALVLEELVRRDERAGGNLNVRAETFVHNNAGDPDTLARAMGEALANRYGVPLQSELAREYAQLTPMAMGRELLELRGIRTSHMSQTAIYERMLTTSDLPTLLTSTGNRLLLPAYNAYAGGIRQIARQSTARDFRAKTMVRLGESPALQKVNEHGEFKYGGLAESAETYRIATYGRIVALTRQAIVNDDLGAFADLMRMQGEAAMQTECSLFVALLTSGSGAGPTMSDSVALFHASHGNLAGSGAAIDVTSLGAGRQAMRLQKGLDGSTPIDVRPKFLLVPASLETTAEQYLTQLQANAATSVNPFGGQLTLVVDPRLDAVSTTRWYLAADPGQVPSLEYSYLEDSIGPQVFVDESFDVDGVRFKVRLDFGCAALDWRGLYCNDGG